MYITLLIIILLLLSLASLYYHQKNSSNESEYFYQIDDDDDEIVFTEDMIENVQPTLEQLQEKKQLRRKLEMEKEKELQLRRQLQIEEQKEQKLSSQLQQLDSGYTPDYSGTSTCTTRCDCCWKNASSSDRMEACNKKYKSGSKELNECLYSNSRYAHEACKSKFGKGLFFKSC
jgi:hypothetical protein